ncbi:hypothetical protein NQ315_008181 [Exocentrus adspersus]|uniref:N-acetyltransferase domain-containing protein n=1 Tax=Exocentrus adspersus TaxID=1586481 RepID=A0AAV8VWB3_9CUCU|nr:hypothetical protein NQ315_008181 [Exocentrus adspersus]
MVNWKRPDSVPFPSVWRRFEKKGNDGSIKNYWIQDVVPEYVDTFLDNMETVFLKDESLCKYSKFLDDPEAVKQFRDFWINGMKDKLALICLTTDENGRERFVGGNMLVISEKGSKGLEVQSNSKAFKKVMSVVGYVANAKDVFKELNVEEYLTAYGLYVMPEFRGQGIGTELLKARRELCLAVGIKATATVFTSIVSQRTARSAGFQEFVAIDYDDLEKMNPEWSFPGITTLTKSLKNMYIKFK